MAAQQASGAAIGHSLFYSGRPIVKYRQRVAAVPMSVLRKKEFALISARINTGSNPFGDDGNNRATRLGRILQQQQSQVVEKLNDVRKGLPMKIFLLLLGFYSANALATVLGQTGDWDVLAAGIMVAVIEGVGYVLYRKPPIGQMLQHVFKMLNYWKAGFSFGLFVDAFKLGS